MKLEYPVFRHGTIIKNNNPPITVQDAEKIAEAIKEQDSRFLHCLDEGFASMGFVPTDSQKDEETEVIYHKGHIVSFPSQRFIKNTAGQQTVIDGRLCLTVCDQNRKSKLWHRFNLLSVPINTSETAASSALSGMTGFMTNKSIQTLLGRPADQLDATEVTDFNNSMESFAINNKVDLLDIYSSVIAEHLGTEDYKLDVLGNLVFQAADTNDSTFEEFLINLEYVDSRDALNHEDYSEIRKAFDIFSKSNMQKVDRTKSLKVDTIDGGTGWFRRLFGSVAEVETIRSTGVCLSSNMGKTDDLTRYAKSYAQSVTRKMSMHYGSAY